MAMPAFEASPNSEDGRDEDVPQHGNAWLRTSPLFQVPRDTTLTAIYIYKPVLIDKQSPRHVC